MSLNHSEATEESSLLVKMSTEGSRLPKSIYSLYLGVQFQHVEKSTLDADLISAINILTLVSYILQQLLSILFFIVALLRLIDVKDDGMKLFDGTLYLSFGEKCLLFIFGLLMTLVLMLLKVSGKWRVFNQVSQKNDSFWIKASNYAPYVIDLCCLAGMIMFMLVSISFSDLLIPPVIVWFILNIDEFCYDSLITLCPDKIIESLLYSNIVDEVCTEGIKAMKTTVIGSTIGWSLIIIMFIIFFFALDE